MDYCKKCGQHVTTMLTHDCSKHESCPSCAALRARVEVLEKVVDAVIKRCGDVEGIAKVLHKLHPFCSYPSARLIKEWDALSYNEKVPYLREATAVSAWLKEG
jgi:hypothetical protein